jgi:hypothetical protein
MSLSTLLSEKDVRPFSYYWKADICTGMILHGRLYGLLDYYSSAHRAKAFERGYALSARHDVVVSVVNGTHTAYKLWVALNPQTEPLLALRSSCYRSSGVKAESPVPVVA